MFLKVGLKSKFLEDLYLFLFGQFKFKHISSSFESADKHQKMYISIKDLTQKLDHHRSLTWRN